MKKVIAEHLFQDQNIAFFDDAGAIHCVELEKLLRIKHYCCLTEPLLTVHPEVDKIYRDVIRNNVCKSRLIVNEKFGVMADADTDLVLCYQNQHDNARKSELFAYAERATRSTVVKTNHQENHVLSIIAADRLDDCLALSIDGQGDGNLSIFEFKDNKLTVIYHEEGFSFGEFYETMAAFFVNKGVFTQGVEGKFMAFAGLGKTVNLDRWWGSTFASVKNFNWSQQRLEANVYVLGKLEEVCTKFNAVDVANYVQRAWVQEILATVKPYVGSGRRLAFAGGCALNCLLNQALAESGWFSSIHWSPVPSDTGQSVGALCNYVLGQTHELPSVNWNDLTRGVDDDPEVITDVRRQLTRVDVDRLVNLLVDGGLLGVVRGNVELGPRALGRRSILASPLWPVIARQLNTIKGREDYRPFGIIVHRDKMSDYVDFNLDAKYMNITAHAVGDIPAATHVDGSTRFQTVTTEDDPWLYALIDEFGKRTGIYALINTSFNDSGLPMFNYIADAWRMYQQKLDGLVFDNGMVIKK